MQEDVPLTPSLSPSFESGPLQQDGERVSGSSAEAWSEGGRTGEGYFVYEMSGLEHGCAGWSKDSALRRLNPRAA